MKIDIAYNEGRIIEWLQNTNTPGIAKLIKYMKENGFFTAPCSAGHHLSCEGGLAEHSLSVLQLGIDWLNIYSIPITEKSFTKCALLHDVFKMFLYEKVNGKWQYREDFEYGTASIHQKRHGEASKLIIQTFITLTEQEQEMILWHMGPYSEFYDGHKSGDFLKWSNDKKNKNVNAALFLYFCDHFSSMFLED